VTFTLGEETEIAYKGAIMELDKDINIKHFKSIKHMETKDPTDYITLGCND
jgi:hypothetical protein